MLTDTWKLRLVRTKEYKKKKIFSLNLMMNAGEKCIKCRPFIIDSIIEIV